MKVYDPKRVERERRHERVDSMLRARRAHLLDLIARSEPEESGGIPRLRYPIFASMCDAVYDAVKLWLDQQADFPFYFWPGYDSILRERGRLVRVELRSRSIVPSQDNVACGISPPYHFGAATGRCHAQIRQVLKLRNRSIGPWLPTDKRWQSNWNVTGLINGVAANAQLRILNNPTSLWYSALLIPHEDSRFMPGGTHRWLSEQDLKDKSGRMLRGLIVSCTSNAPPRVVDGFVHILVGNPQRKEALLTSGSTLGKCLDSLIPRTYWAWPASLKDRHPSGVLEADPDRSLRRTLYSAWLTAVFGENPLPIGNLLTKNADLLYLRDRMESLTSRQQKLSREYAEIVPLLSAYTRYTHWISLKIDKSWSVSHIGSQRAAALGTAMLFTDRDIPTECLLTLRGWIENIYLSLRQFEVTKYTQTRTIDSILDSSSHETEKAHRGILMRMQCDAELILARAKVRSSKQCAKWIKGNDLGIVPQWTIYKHLLSVIRLWSNPKEPVISTSEVTWRSYTDQLIDRAASMFIATILRLSSIDYEDLTQRLKEFEQKKKTLISFVRNKSPDEPIITDGSYWPWTDDARRAQGGIVEVLRIFCASFMNACKHGAKASHPRFEVFVGPQRGNAPAALLIQIKNKFKRARKSRSDVKKSVTHKHAKTCDILRMIASRLDGHVTAFPFKPSGRWAVTEICIPAKSSHYLRGELQWVKE